nr:xanthine phosphoribosyltransferase [bacterium]
MEALKNRVLRDGKVLPGGILKVDSFLNHQMDPVLMRDIGREFAARFADSHVTRVLTVEASGIAPAIFAGLYLGVPVVFAKKARSSNVPGEVYAARAHSYTKGNDNQLTCAKEYIAPGERVLVIDDFLAMGEAAGALVSLIDQAGAVCAGIGVIIEKGFQPGGDKLRGAGLRVESLLTIDCLGEDGTIACH